jgi:SAM-dependent methyltransferase
MRLNDEGFVREQYASTERLSTRVSVWQPAAGERSPQDIVVDALREHAPRRVLEVGCGTGDLAARIVAELACEVVAVDQSAEMVAAARGRGVDARVGDLQRLPFSDGGFDCAVAAWMLYHVADLDRGLGELARVLAPGGRLVAVTNGRDHLAELYDAVGGEKLSSSFSRENGAELLRRHFAKVARSDLAPRAVFADRAAAAAYLESLERGALAERLGPVSEPLVAHGAVSVFVAETSA